MDFLGVVFETSWGWCGALLSPLGVRRMSAPFSSEDAARDWLGGIVAALDSHKGGSNRRSAVSLRTLSLDEANAARNPVQAPKAAAPADHSDSPRALDSLADALVLQIRAYFDSGRNDFSLPFDWNNATLFQRRVWEAVRRVPFGETRTYGEIAVECGHPGAARAVGTVMKSNPVALLVPCHRVVAMNGLGGYFGPGGLALKRRLLDHEAPDRPGDLRAKNSSGPCH